MGVASFVVATIRYEHWSFVMSLVSDLKNLECELLDPVVRADPVKMHRLLADDFVEIGQSGRNYDKSGVIRMLAAASTSPQSVSIVDFEARSVGPGLVLATYQIAETKVLRSSLWRLSGQNWQMVFHQGIPMRNSVRQPHTTDFV
ncbi:DUF4440 domain-containing protein [Rhodobacteraceae bacterium M382]|nr:DUF4440 domain-containing protein [Rhodobacteraceae bacterium M382]